MFDTETTPIHRRLEGYRRLMAIARDLASTLDLDRLLDRIVRAAADITDAEAASILLYDDTARQLYFQVATNMDEPTMRGLVVPLEGSIAGWIVTNRKSVRIANVNQDPRHFDDVGQATQYETRSLLGVPMVTQDKVVGVLEAINKREGEFTETEEDFLKVLGAQAAVAIQNSRLFQQSDLVAEFVHELRTPLASLSTATYLLTRPEISHTQRDQIVTNIYSETLRLNALASSFLDLARLESGRVQFRKTQFEINALLLECREIMENKAAEQRISIKIEVQAGVPKLEADRDKLKQVVLNLLSNAIKYNHLDGWVMLRAEAHPKEIAIIVADNGVGIPETALPFLFQKFYRVRETEGQVSGTGLGLSICKQIVQGHGGRMEVKSRVREGTIISVFLPRPRA
jgi:signal transduction histidine kinase